LNAPCRAGLRQLRGCDGTQLAVNNNTHKEIFMKMVGIQAAKGAENIFAMTN